MSRFLVKGHSTLLPYIPGEQPKDKRYIKLNTNESPFPPSPKALEAAKAAADRCKLYSDPDNSALRAALAESYGVDAENIIATNGSDEVLMYAFGAFADEDSPLLFADITYGFYSVVADYLNIPYERIPLGEGFTLSVDDYIARRGTAVIANPNAPTGIALPISEIERLLAADPERVVIIDEAYVDFGAESAASLTKKYDNLIVTMTYSKSRSMAGARLGFAIASEALVADMNTLRCASNPYNVNSMTAAMGIGALADREYFEANCKAIAENREYLVRELKALGFDMTDSCTNFVFARHEKTGGEELYCKLRERGILVRHFTAEKIKDYNRITISTMDDMTALVKAIKTIINN